eukprot:CAMPEP_0171224536 /NCGR_PEP_ID=MMETSP0790-20130122/36341_1 /TAXON_ID=2925 /ORGANISM="Alexandrium catenella, Strain OF101" /LENGTH=101 /DNA_ID=CAMNT_0011690539 /DNA_START=266 /DNA_END=567 /DNA_ORIENTATION=-
MSPPPAFARRAGPLGAAGLQQHLLVVSVLRRAARPAGLPGSFVRRRCSPAAELGVGGCLGRHSSPKQKDSQRPPEAHCHNEGQAPAHFMHEAQRGGRPPVA